LRWLAILLAPVAGLVASFVSLLGLGVKDRSAAEVARYLRDFIDGTGGDWDWDDFESVPIRDQELDRIRQEASRVGPPDPDLDRLRELLRQAESLAVKGS
jgi:hypothetical protein